MICAISHVCLTLQMDGETSAAITMITSHRVFQPRDEWIAIPCTAKVAPQQRVVSLSVSVPHLHPWSGQVHVAGGRNEDDTMAIAKRDRIR